MSPGKGPVLPTPSSSERGPEAHPDMEAKDGREPGWVPEDTLGPLSAADSALGVLI